MRINLYIDSCIKESNKREFIVESEACCDKKWETSILEMLIYGFYSWLDIFEEYLRYKIVKKYYCNLHGVKQKEKTYTYVLHIDLILWSLQCLKYCYQSWLRSKTSTSLRKDRNKCSCITWWFLDMACQSKACLVLRIKSSWLQSKTKKWRYMNEIWNSLLMCKV